MNKKGTKALASATLMSLVLTTALATGNVKAAANGQATRVGGTDRYETAAKVATANFADGSDNVVLVSGEGYADSVSASVLAKELKAPIVLTGSKSLDANAKSAISTLKAKNVFIVGGNASVSKSIEDGLKSDYKVTRLGGDDRYATNLAVANYLADTLKVSKDNIIAVAGTGFPDALSVAPVAAAKDQILLLTNNNADVLKKTADFAKDSNVTVVGTTTVVSNSAYDQLKADKRIDGGTDRFDTNLKILSAFNNDLKADKLYVANATGEGYADALVASAIAGKYAAPLVLTNTDQDDDAATKNAVKYIGTKATKDTDLQVVGGTGVVSDNLIQKIKDTVVPPVTDLAISSVDYVNSKKIVINFNKPVENTGAIEDDVNRVVVYPAGQSLGEFNTINNDNIRSTSISFSNDKKTATVFLNKELETGKNYKLDLIDTVSDNLNVAKSIVSYTGVLSKGIDVPTATVNNDQNNIVVTYSQKMSDSAKDAGNYSVYDSDNNPISSALTSGDWDDATTKKVVKLKINTAKLKAGETYKVVAADSVIADDGTQLSKAQKTFKVVTPGLSDTKPVLKVARVSGEHELKLTFSKDLTDTITADSITVKKAGGAKLDIDTNTIGTDSKEMTITTNNSSDKFEDGKTYTVSLDANAVRNKVFTNAGNDKVDNFSISTPENASVKTLSGKFVQDSQDNTKYNAVFTFDQQVYPTIDAADISKLSIVDLSSGKSYAYTGDASNIELYSDDSTGKSLVVKDINSNFKNDSKGLSTESGKSYKLVVAEQVIKTNSLVTDKAKNTSELSAIIGGVNTGTPAIDTVTLKSAKEIDVNLKNTANAADLKASDVHVQGFVKAINGSVTPATLSGNQINVSASGSTLKITPKDNAILATGQVGTVATAKLVNIDKETLKNSNGAVNDADSFIEFNSSDITDDAAPELVGAKTGVSVSDGGINKTKELVLTYTENAKFKTIGVDATLNKEATTQFDLKGSELNKTVMPTKATPLDLTSNTSTLTFDDYIFNSGKDYSDAKVSYTSNPDYKVQDKAGNDASTVTLTGIFNELN